MSRVSVIIPALDEPYLTTLLKELHDYHVDVRTEPGLSYAVWCGVQKAESDIVVVMDGDGSHPPEAISHMVKMLNEKVWLVVGSRYVKRGYSGDSLLRKIMSLFYCKLAQIVLRTRIKDAMSGFWCGYRKAFTFIPSTTYKFGVQLLRQYHAKIREYPIIFKKRKQGKSHIKPIQAILDLLSIFMK